MSNPIPNVWQNVATAINVNMFYDSGDQSATIYGNDLNCVGLNVTFNGQTIKREIVDLGGFDAHPHVELIHFRSGEPFPQQYVSTGFQQVFYHQGCSGYTDLPPNQLVPRFPRSIMPPDEPTPAERRMQCAVKFYVYAGAMIDFDTEIAVKFTFVNFDPSINTMDTSRYQGQGQKLLLRILKPVRYGLGDVTPLNFDLIKQENDVKLYSSLIRPNNKDLYWKHHQFSRSHFAEKVLIIKAFQHDNKVYVYEAASLGTDHYVGQVEIGNFKLPVEYNREAGAFTVLHHVLPASYAPLYEHITETHKEIPTVLRVKLFDQHGNFGKFSFEWDDPTTMKLKHVE